jgi:6-phosphogluconolactonase (cycloisomerase 2 family)
MKVSAMKNLRLLAFALVGMISGFFLACGGVARPASASSPAAFLFVSNTNENTIASFLINDASGSLVLAGGPFASGGSGPGRAAVDSSNRFLFVVNQSSGSVSSYRINSATGTLTLGGTTPTGTLPTALAVHPAKTFLYVLNQEGTISGLSFDANGIFSPLPRSPFPLGITETGAQEITLDTSGQFLFATTPAGISVFQVGTDGSLTLFSALTGIAGILPTGIAIDPASNFIYSLDSGGSNSSQGKLFGFESLAGTVQGTPLTALAGTPVDAGISPTWISLLPSGAFAYAGEGPPGNGIIQAFSLNASGTPILLGGFAVPATPNVVQIAIDPAGKYLYSANSATTGSAITPASSSIAGFTINSTTGFLTPVPNSPLSLTSAGGVAMVRFTP